MEQITTIGIDIAKTVFQVHGINETGEVVVRRQLRRRQVLPFFGKLAPDQCDARPHGRVRHCRRCRSQRC